MSVDEALAALEAAKGNVKQAYSVWSAAESRLEANERAAWRAAGHHLKAAQTAYDEAVAAAATHEWICKKVIRTVQKDVSGRHSFRRRYEEKTETGIVEIYRPGTKLTGYFGVSPGEPVVRLMLASGKPGAKCVPLERDGVVDKWTLA